jgi:hypothetical protein
VLTLLSVIFTAFRRRSRNARKRPRGSVYLGNMEHSNLDTFLSQARRPNVSSIHSSVPLLSVPQVGTDSREEPPTEYRDTPDHGHGVAAPVLPSPLSDHDHNTVQNGDEGTDTGHSSFLPSPYSQLGHGGDESDTVAGEPQSRSMTNSPRPESTFYAPIAVQGGDFSLAALERSTAGSRSGTPTAHTPARATTSPVSDEAGVLQRNSD